MVHAWRTGHAAAGRNEHVNEVPLVASDDVAKGDASRMSQRNTERGHGIRTGRKTHDLPRTRSLSNGPHLTHGHTQPLAETSTATRCRWSLLATLPMVMPAAQASETWNAGKIPSENHTTCPAHVGLSNGLHLTHGQRRHRPKRARPQGTAGHDHIWLCCQG